MKYETNWWIPHAILHWGPSHKLFSVEIEIHLEFFLSKYQYNYHYKILYMPRQLCCHGMYKIL